MAGNLAPPLRSRCVRLFAALLGIAAFSPLAAGRLPLQAFDLSRGLAGDNVWDLELDETGALWVATSTGVSRFDGARFRNFDIRHGLPHVNVLRLLRLADGRLAAATGAGVSILDPVGATGETPWRTLPSDVERGGGQIVELAEDGDGVLWAAGLRGLFRVERRPAGERLVAMPTPEGFGTVRNVVPAGRDGRDGLWVASDRGLARRGADGTWSAPWPLPAALADITGLSSLATDGQGTLWVSSRTALCGLVPRADRQPGAEGAFTPAPLVALADARPPHAGEPGLCVDVERGLPFTRSRRMIEPAPGGRWFVTGSAGVVEIGPERLTLRLSAVEALGASLQSVLEGTDGTLWIGTAARGLLRFVRSGIELESDADGFPGAVSTLLVRGEEVAVVLDHLDTKRRLLRRDGERFADVSPPGLAALETSWGWGAASLLDSRLDWWVGVSGGLVRFPRLVGGRYGAAQAPPAALARALAGRKPIRLFLARDEALWVSSYEPVTLHRADLGSPAVRRFSEVERFPSGPATAFAEAGDGTLFLGFFQGGLARSRDAADIEWLEPAAAVVRGFVYALRFDRRGRLWIAAGGGLARCESPLAADPECRRAFPGSEVDHLQIFGVTEDRLGRILAATAKGLFVLDPASGGSGRLTTAEGLPGNNLTSLDVAADGVIWLAADRALGRFVPEPPGAGVPPAKIVALAVAGRARDVPLGGASRLPLLELGPAERIVEIEAASVHLAPEEAPAYQWRIGDGDWSPPSTERSLRLAGLTPGRTSVEVRAVSAAGIASGEPARVDLRILPPFWRRSWFLAALALALAAGLAAAYRLRVRRLVELERVRTRIASDLHDDLGSSLSRISILAEVARRQAGGGDADSTLETIGASARELAEMASDIVWAIDPQRDDLASLVARLRRFGDDLFAPRGVGFEVGAPPEAASIRLAAALRRDLYLLAKEALNNAAKYSAAGRVRVAAVRRPGRLEILIEDDGRGFDAGAVERAEARGGGRGLRTMRERAARLGATLQIDSRPAGGTRIELSIPL